MEITPNKERINVGDYVAVAWLVKSSKHRLLGIVKRIDGAYFYVEIDYGLQGKHEAECYEWELEKITEQEYFKRLLRDKNE